MVRLFLYVSNVSNVANVSNVSNVSNVLDEYGGNVIGNEGQKPGDSRVI